MTESRFLDEWIQEIKDLCQPDSIHYCDGSQEERQALRDLMVKQGTLIKLDESKRPASYLCRSDPQDVARVEESTFICSRSQEEAGPTNVWKDPVEMKARLRSLFKGCMKGRTLYVIPFSMGPLGSPFSYFGVQLTDSPYVVCSMEIMTRMGQAVDDSLRAKNQAFVPCLHSVGAPLDSGRQDVSWPCNPKNRTIAHFPESREIWSFGSGYGGNALLGKKCFALRIASVMARQEGWLAEHMLIVGITNPTGEKKYFAAAFPSACGKTNLAMLKPTLPGWKIETVGDDIAWMRIGQDGRLYAINPEAGFFGVAPGTSMQSNPNAMLSLTKNAIFTNVALTDEGDAWWEGMTERPPAHAINWLGHEWTPDSLEKAAHPNARFTVSAAQCPVIDEKWQSPEGVPISAILFGGRRASVMPLVYEAFDWRHGTFLGASLSSETTAAASGKIGQLRHDPFAMLPFCGYHMGDYFSHWLEFGKQHADKGRLPRFYAVNWFLKDSAGQFRWPGFGENSRVLKWIFERTAGQGEAVDSPIGWLPAPGALDLNGLSLTEGDKQALLTIDVESWKEELKALRSYFHRFEHKLPQGIKEELDHLEARLSDF